ncbi:tripartite tricarboxylate transporter substrate binding protein [Cupriavidus sp. WKF15]|uniref:Bug family tripartite tricarboxylate transporter substrate binding protein n=1 Tax=Cupriavidus sp. WKF15 TaxID=3032282 RepID=UPI0023E0E44D|nr:tripartite tricarboxylate transporter substrate binding protein [Cupriavidus sp. WKF15]WER47529.1 tripartite tricarboxylate transporter substrate binding protein [Cupriavidus sp. WKF15]
MQSRNSPSSHAVPRRLGKLAAMAVAIGATLAVAAAGLLPGVANAAADASAQAAWKPSKPITFIVPFPPAGINDVLARAVAQRLSSVLGQPVVVENRPGASGNIGAEALVRAAPDGHTIGILNSIHGVNAAFYRKLPYDVAHDLVPVAPLGESPLVLVTNPRTPFKSVPELIAYAKANPGKVNYGGPTSYPLEMIKTMAGVDIANIPYKGSGPTINDMIAGHIDLATGPLLEYMPHVNAGKLKLLAVGTSGRLKALPGVPTVAESIPGYDITVWYGVFAPKGTPAPIVERLRGEIRTIMNDAEIRAKLAGLSVDTAFSQTGVTGLTNRLASETQRAQRIVAKTGGYLN